MFLKFITQILHDGTVTSVVFVASRVETDHTLALLLFKSFLPTAEMIIEGFGREGLVRVCGVHPDRIR